VQQHPLRRRSCLRKPLPCCAEEFDRAHPSIAWRRVPSPKCNAYGQSAEKCRWDDRIFGKFFRNLRGDFVVDHESGNGPWQNGVRGC
jgi:hypothetical protein